MSVTFGGADLSKINSLNVPSLTESTTVTTSFSGAWTIPHDVTLGLYKYGRFVNINFPRALFGASTANTISSPGAIPLGFRPKNTDPDPLKETLFPAFMYDNTTYNDGGYCYIRANGDVTFALSITSPNFTGAGSTGWFELTATYETS